MVTQRMVTQFPPPVGAVQPGHIPMDTAAWCEPMHGSIDSVREEVDSALEHAKVFFQLNPDEAMRYAGGYSARMSELKVWIKRIEANIPGWRSVRTDEVEPCQEEMRFQYENHSRLHTAREFDWRVETGER